MKSGEVAVKRVRVADLKEYAHNPRRNDGAVEYVANSIKSFGFRVPVVVDADNVIIAGHTRYKAAGLRLARLVEALRQYSFIKGTRYEKI